MSKLKLGALPPGKLARITAIAEDADGVFLRLMEMGLLEGSNVEVAFVAPFSGDPIALRIRGALLAIRKAEANLVEVEV